MLQNFSQFFPVPATLGVPLPALLFAPPPRTLLSLFSRTPPVPLQNVEIFSTLFVLLVYIYYYNPERDSETYSISLSL